MMNFSSIPSGSVLGLNYSGMHDSAIAIVSPTGAPIFAMSLERLSRAKQDGRPPYALLEGIPWERISKVAVSTEAAFHHPEQVESRLLETRLPLPRSSGLEHRAEFHAFLDWVPCEKEFVCHQLAHASSAFWGSGFDDALCLTYDGGMCNSPWFGGLFQADRRQGIRSLDQFSALHYAKVTSLYTFVTALLGFTPNKHEGKVTGLAAFGRPTQACRALLRKWFEEEFLSIESVMEWVFAYDSEHIPILFTNEAKIRPFRDAASSFSREELAAAVQEFAERHVLELLSRAKDSGWYNDNICLAGGLFANVKINQRIAEAGFRRLFVAPPMTDDGTALGAAWHVLSRQPGFHPESLQSVHLGPSYSGDTVRHLLEAQGIKFEIPHDPARKVAELLAAGKVVAIFQGKMEFGPRALGNRSILAQATAHDINRSLNARLNRTEFMPFAPVSRSEDAEVCYLNIERVRHAAEFMTVTVNCSDMMRMACPAVVHVDGTARPQLVSALSNPFVYAVLTHYKDLTGHPALVNTSFNIHEEPIVCSPDDALKGFFESGLDYLLLGEGKLVSYADNKEVALRYLQDRLRVRKPHVMAAIADWQSIIIAESDAHLAAKETVIQELVADRSSAANAHRLLEIQLSEKERYVQELLSKQALFNELNSCQLAEKERYIQELLSKQALLNELNSYQLAEKEKVIQELVRRYGVSRHIDQFVRSLSAPLRRIYSRTVAILRPRLGNLNQYSPRPIQLNSPDTNSSLGESPRISIVTPSFQQGHFIERTLKSVLDQNYPNLEYIVQDGGSQDQTVEVLRAYEGRIASWESRPDTGQSQAINRGFSRATGEIMAWLNSDDLLLPGSLRSIADYFAANPDVDVVYGNRVLIDESDQQIGRWILPGHDNKALSWADYVPQETLFWRRRIWEKSGGQVDESFRFAMDWDLLVRFRDAGARFAHLPRFLGAFRIHEHQKTSAAINEVGYQEMNRIRERLLGRVPRHDEIRKAVFPFLLRHIAVDLAYRVKTTLGFGK